MSHYFFPDFCCYSLTLRVPVAPDLKSLLCYSCRLTVKDMVRTPQLYKHYNTD